MKIDDDSKRDLIRERAEAVRFFGQQGMKERERLMFGAFLRGLKLAFNPKEINSVAEEFPDVEFQVQGSKSKKCLIRSGNGRINTKLLWKKQNI
jgi:hypothetical protein